jgi:hypothetical protein
VVRIHHIALAADRAMVANSISESRTPPEVALGRGIMSDVPSDQYTTRWVDDRPSAGERSWVISVPDRDRADLPLQFRDDAPGNGCSVSVLDVDHGVEIAIWCGRFVKTGSDAEI